MSEGLIATAQTLAGPVTWVLIHSLWLGGLLAIGLAITLNLLRRKTPQLRYTVACLTLLLVMPMSVSIVAYDTVSQEMMYNSSVSGNIAKETLADGQTETAATAQNSTSSWTEVGLLKDLNRNQAAPWVLLVWLAGVSSMLFYHLTGWWRARKVIRSDSDRVPPVWQERFQRLCQRAGVTSTARLLSCAVTRMPCVVGFVKPTILLPVSLFSGLEAGEIEMILAHELAHVRRYDVLVNYIQTAIETVLFFNPAVWYISRQIRVEREHCCDDFAVAVCGDRVAYARALASLETFRTWQPRLAPGANGTSLVKRIRRLAQTAGNKRRRPGLSVIGALTLVAVLTIGFGVSAAFSPQNVPAVTDNTATTYQEQDDDIHGYWEIEPNGKRIGLQMRFRSRGGRTGSTYYDDDFTGLKEGSDVQFQLIKDAGTFFFEGDVENDGGEYWGEGECHFRSNPDYIDEMAKLGYRIRSSRDAWELAIHDVRLSFAKGIHDAGYDRISRDRLIELHIHRVSPEYIAELSELGYSDISLDRLVEMRIHKVTPEYIKELQETGCDDLDPRELVEMRIHRVDPEYIKGFADLGYRNLRQSKLVEMSIHRVTPRFVKELQELGYDKIKPSKLVEMQIHRVDTDFIRQLVELGYDDIPTSDLVAMRIHNVSPSWVEDLSELGYNEIDPDDLVAMRIHDVSARFIKRLQEDGYDDLSPEDLVEMKIHGIDRHRDSGSRQY